MMAVKDKPLIAVVDDDEMVGEATRELVETFGISAVSFSSAEAFLNSDCVSKTACLIADVHMPGMSGLQLYRKVTGPNRRIPVIFITAYPDERLREDALQAGAIGYMYKPFDPGRLLDCIQRAIGHWEGEPDS